MGKKLKAVVQSKNSFVHATKMQSGDIGIIKDMGNSYFGELVLKTHASFVLLTDPNIIWINPSYDVELLPSGSIVTLTVQ